MEFHNIVIATPFPTLPFLVFPPALPTTIHTLQIRHKERHSQFEHGVKYPGRPRKEFLLRAVSDNEYIIELPYHAPSAAAAAAAMHAVSARTPSGAAAVSAGASSSSSSSAVTHPKLMQVLEIVNGELGGFRGIDGNSSNNANPAASKGYLYIKAGRVVGCIVAEQIKHAFRLLIPAALVDDSSSGRARTQSRAGAGSTGSIAGTPLVGHHGGTQGTTTTAAARAGAGSAAAAATTAAVAGAAAAATSLGMPTTTTATATTTTTTVVASASPPPADVELVCRSEEAVKACCGIQRMWVHRAARRQGVAKRMLDCIRAEFIFATRLQKDDLAFSLPTPDGKAFAEKYTGRHDFLVYT